MPPKVKQTALFELLSDVAIFVKQEGLEMVFWESAGYLVKVDTAIVGVLEVLKKAGHAVPLQVLYSAFLNGRPCEMSKDDLFTFVGIRVQDSWNKWVRFKETGDSKLQALLQERGIAVV